MYLEFCNIQESKIYDNKSIKVSGAYDRWEMAGEGVTQRPGFLSCSHSLCIPGSPSLSLGFSFL